MACGSDDDNVKGSIEVDEAWEGEIRVPGNIHINAVVTIKPCTTILIGSGAEIMVTDSGSIQSKGTEDCPVTFRSAKAEPKAGDWGAMHIGSSETSVFEHTNILHGGGREREGILNVSSDGKVAVRNARFESSANNGVNIRAGAVLDGFENVHFEKIDGVPLEVPATLAGKLEGITGTDLKMSWIELLSHDKLTDTQSWKKQGIPYYLTYGLKVTGSLEIEAGTTILMAEDGILAVEDGGTLKTNGTADSRVVIQSSKSEPGEGDWDYIKIEESASEDSLLKYTTVRHGGSSGSGAVFLGMGATIAFDHVIFEKNKDCDVTEKFRTVEVIDTSFVACE